MKLKSELYESFSMYVVAGAELQLLHSVEDRDQTVSIARPKTRQYKTTSRYLDTGYPADTVERFLGLLQPLAEAARRLYPGWRMRIYHNVTEEDSEVALLVYSVMGL